MHTSLAPGAQMLFRLEWRKLETLLCFSIVLANHVASLIGMSFFSVFPVLGWSLLVLHFWWNVCNWITKMIWSQMNWFWGFLLEYGFFRRIHIWVDWNLQELLKLVSLLTTSSLFDKWLEGVFWSAVLCCLYFLAIGFWKIDWKALAMHWNKTFFSFCSRLLPKVVIKHLFEYLWNPIGPFSRFCVKCLLFFYFVYCNKCVLKVVNGAIYCTFSSAAPLLLEKFL